MWYDLDMIWYDMIRYNVSWPRNGMTMSCFSISCQVYVSVGCGCGCECSCGCVGIYSWWYWVCAAGPARAQVSPPPHAHDAHDVAVHVHVGTDMCCWCAMWILRMMRMMMMMMLCWSGVDVLWIVSSAAVCRCILYRSICRAANYGAPTGTEPSNTHIHDMSVLSASCPPSTRRILVHEPYSITFPYMYAHTH